MLEPYPSEKYEFVSWDYYSQYTEKSNSCSKPPTSIWWCANNCYRNIVVYWGKPTIEGPLCCVCSSISQLQIYPRMNPGYFSYKPIFVGLEGLSLHFVAYPTVISSWYWWIQRQRATVVLWGFHRATKLIGKELCSSAIPKQASFWSWSVLGMGAPETHGGILKIQWLKEMNIPMLQLALMYINTGHAIIYQYISIWKWNVRCH